MKTKNRKSIDQAIIKTALPLFLAIIGIFVSITSFLGTFVERDKAGLPTQIREVEDAIRNLRNLENYLEKTKNEMIATKQAKDKIEEEYSQAKELEKLTNRQIEAISLAVNKRTKTDVIIDYFWGFVLGVASSLVASYIYGMIKRKSDENEQTG